MGHRNRVGKQAIEYSLQLAVRDFLRTKGGRCLKPYAFQVAKKRPPVTIYTVTMVRKPGHSEETSTPRSIPSISNGANLIPLGTGKAHTSLSTNSFLILVNP